MSSSAPNAQCIFLLNAEQDWSLEVAQDIHTWKIKQEMFWTMRVRAEFVKCEKDFRSTLDNLEIVLGELSRQQLIFVVLDIAMKRCEYGATMNKSNTI